jgi:hypothetical protein
MYVMVQRGGHIFAFGLTPEKTQDYFVRRKLYYDGPPLEIRRCSPALYRRLERDEAALNMMRCRINSHGVAVSLKRSPKVISRR